MCHRKKPNANVTLGLREPETLAELIDLYEGAAHRCAFTQELLRAAVCQQEELRARLVKALREHGSWRYRDRNYYADGPYLKTMPARDAAEVRLRPVLGSARRVLRTLAESDAGAAANAGADGSRPVPEPSAVPTDPTDDQNGQPDFSDDEADVHSYEVPNDDEDQDDDDSGSCYGRVGPAWTPADAVQDVGDNEMW